MAIEAATSRRVSGSSSSPSKSPAIQAGSAVQACDQVGGVVIAAGMRRIPATTERRVAPERHDMANARLPVMLRHAIDLSARGPDTGEVRRRLERRLPADAHDGCVGAL